VSPPSLATRVRRALDDASIPWGGTLLVACSGGIDSQVLLDTLAHVADTSSPRRGPRIRLVAHGVDHGLRGEATQELGLAQTLAEAHRVPFGVTKVELERGGNLQARARELRMRALRDAATRANALKISTAHTLDDRAETVLIRVVRGAPLAALAVLPLVSGDVLRPLIEARRSEVQAAAARRKIPFARDPSNDDRRFLRARVRYEVLPMLRALDPRIVEHLAGLADDAAAATFPGDSGSFSLRRRR